MKKEKGIPLHKYATVPCSMSTRFRLMKWMSEQQISKHDVAINKLLDLVQK